MTRKKKQGFQIRCGNTGNIYVPPLDTTGGVERATRVWTAEFKLSAKKEVEPKFCLKRNCALLIENINQSKKKNTKDICLSDHVAYLSLLAAIVYAYATLKGVSMK